MTGMETIVKLRRQGLQPDCVMLDLVCRSIHLPSLSQHGNVTVEITDADLVADLDLRPLHGLYVIAQDHTMSPARYRLLCKRVALVNPRLFVMQNFGADGSYTVHRREGGATPKTETYRHESSSAA